MSSISDLCQKGDHENCLILQPQNLEYPNCQCDCHPGTMAATFTAEKGMVDKPP